MNEYVGKAERLLRLISLFQHRRKLSAEEIEDELGVSKRTVYRYTNEISQLGHPVYYDYTLRKHVLLDTGSSTLARLTKEEAELLCDVIRHATAHTSSSYQERLKTILAKLNIKYRPLLDDSDLNPTEGVVFGRILSALEQSGSILITTQNGRKIRFESPGLAHSESWELIDRAGRRPERIAISEIAAVTVKRPKKRRPGR